MWQFFTISLLDWIIPDSKSNTPIHWIGRMVLASAIGYFVAGYD